MNSRKDTHDIYGPCLAGLAFGCFLFYFTFFEPEFLMEKSNDLVFFMISSFSLFLIFGNLWLIYLDVKDLVRKKSNKTM